MLQKINCLLNKCFWRTVSDHPSLIKLKQESIKPFKNSTPEFEDDEINKSFAKDNTKWYHHECAYKLSDGTLIEPSNKICVKGFRTLINESRSNFYILPSLKNYLIFRLLFKRVTRFEQAILFDNTAGLNYFHFFSDVISKLWLAEKLNLSKEIPVIIPEELYHKSYFQYLLKTNELQSWNWIIQKKTDWFYVNTIFLLKCFPYNKSYWLKTLTLIKNHKTEPVKRIFLNRPYKDGRYLKNFSVIEPILKKYKFVIIDTSGMTFEQQFETFSEAEIVIAVHGAGNTNILFSNHEKVKFAEIMPADRIACQYYWLSLTLGISYDVIIGSELTPEKSFTLSPEKLETLIQKLILPPIAPDKYWDDPKLQTPNSKL